MSISGENQTLRGHSGRQLVMLGSLMTGMVAPWEQLWKVSKYWHQQNVKWFGSYNWTTQQLWTATLILTEASRCSLIGWMQCDVISGDPRLYHQCFPMLRKLWNRIPESLEDCIVVFKMLQNQTIRKCKFWSYCKYWEYWPHLQDYSGPPPTWRHALWEWYFLCRSQIVQFN
jgi:hypothetical protein